MVRADPDPDVHDQLRVHGDAAGAVLDHAGGALRGVPGPGDHQLVMIIRHTLIVTTTGAGPLPGHRGEGGGEVGPHHVHRLHHSHGQDE